LLQVWIGMILIHIRQLLILIPVVRGLLPPTLPLFLLLLRLRDLRARSCQFSILFRIRSTDYFELAANGRATLSISLPTRHHSMAELLANRWGNNVYLLSSDINGLDDPDYFCTCTNILPSFAEVASLQLGMFEETTRECTDTNTR